MQESAHSLIFLPWPSLVQSKYFHRCFLFPDTEQRRLHSTNQPQSLFDRNEVASGAITLHCWAPRDSVCRLWMRRQGRRVIASVEDTDLHARHDHQLACQGRGESIIYLCIANIRTLNITTPLLSGDRQQWAGKKNMDTAVLWRGDREPLATLTTQSCQPPDYKTGRQCQLLNGYDD